MTSLCPKVALSLPVEADYSASWDFVAWGRSSIAWGGSCRGFRPNITLWKKAEGDNDGLTLYFLPLDATSLSTASLG